MKHLRPLLAISIALITSVPLHGAKTPTIASEDLSTFTPQDNLAFSIGLQAYLYALPLSWMEYTMQKMTTQPGEQGNAPLGTFGHATRLMTPKDNFIVTPNNNTLYSSAWVDLTKEPYVLHIPEINDRYYSFALYDAWTNVFSLLSNRTRGTKEGTYVIVGPNWPKQVPNNLEKIDAPTNLIWILVRTLVNDETDIPNVMTLQKKFGITPLSMFSPGNFKTVPQPTKARYTEHKNIPNDLQFFDQIGQYFVNTPPRADEQCLLSWFKTIGITPTGLHTVSTGATGLARVEAAATQIIDTIIKNKGTRVNGWTMFIVPQDYGDNYLLRATITYKGLGALPAQEALYPMSQVDANGNPLNGNGKYILHFNKNQMPPVDGFWSLSMYSQSTFGFVENEINRYSIGDHTKDLKYNDDGSLDIYIQKQKPVGKETNWLPAPAENFYVVLRLYDPQEAILNGTWKVPGISRK